VKTNATGIFSSFADELLLAKKNVASYFRGKNNENVPNDSSLPVFESSEKKDPTNGSPHWIRHASCTVRPMHTSQRHKRVVSVDTTGHNTRIQEKWLQNPLSMTGRPFVQ